MPVDTQISSRAPTYSTEAIPLNDLH